MMCFSRVFGYFGLRFERVAYSATARIVITRIARDVFVILSVFPLRSRFTSRTSGDFFFLRIHALNSYGTNRLNADLVFFCFVCCFVKIK